MSTSTAARPAPQTAMSFSRLDSAATSPKTLTRTRSSTLTKPLSLAESPLLATALTSSPDKDDQDSFFAAQDDEIASPVTPSTYLASPQNFDDLPVEIRSLTDRFVESLSAKVHPTPLTIEALGDLFQDFYRRAEKPISTHIAALSSKLSRESTLNNVPKKKTSDKPEQQMLTPSELSERKRARKLLDLKKLALEEAVERAVCEKVYPKLWHHRNSDDEQMDQKLRSRVAALSLVGIGLKELLVSGSEDMSDLVRKKTVEQEDKIKESLSTARISIQEMSNEKYPLGKLNHLVNAHKSIVDTLSAFFPSSSSADEILPTIIYTLITSPPETINVSSDLHFIQRFRSTAKLDGEAAYCLVNLEAAISFLETVELPSLRADESLQGPDKTSTVPSTPQKETAPMQLGIEPVDPLSTEPFPTLVGDVIPQKPVVSSTRSSRSLSELIQAQTNKLEAASDSFRGAVLDSADQAVGALNNTIENSFKFLFGRIREEQQIAGEGIIEVPAPKTLEEARKLVSTPPPIEDDSSLGSPPRDNTSLNQDFPTRSIETPASSKMLDLVGGRRLRERSVDSSRSGGSNKHVSFSSPVSDPLAEKAEPLIEATSAPAISPLTALPGNAAVESMRSLGSSLNPLNQFARIGLFSRSTSSLPSPNAVIAPPLSSPRPVTPIESKALAVTEEVRKMQPPSKKFLECKDARELRIGDLEELLAEYQRMAAIVHKIRKS